MPTDIYSFFEVRHPHADAEWNEWEPWVCLMALSPLYGDGNYGAFGCLFGVRNGLVLATGRGRPWPAGRRLGSRPGRLREVVTARRRDTRHHLGFLVRIT